MEKEIETFLSVKDFSNKHTGWTQQQLRWIIANREKNGFKSVLRKVGKRVMIDEAAFFAKIDNSLM